jgi:acyl-CoA oxidase
LFKEHRIPRENMLMKFAQVDKNGVYRPPVHSKLSYGSMVKLRAMMVPEAGWKLAQALTVSVRYCTVRRQFQPANLNKADEPTSGPESQVISYSGVQHRLFPLISIAYGLIITGFTVTKLFDEMTEQLASEDATLLPQVHVLTCGLKSWGTRRACDGIEECRKAMGGHGYSAFSGLSDLFASYIPSSKFNRITNRL